MLRMGISSCLKYHLYQCFFLGLLYRSHQENSELKIIAIFFWWLLFAAKHHVSIGNWNYNRGKLNTDRMKQYFSRCFLATLFGFLECKISLSVARNADALQPFTGLCA